MPLSDLRLHASHLIMVLSAVVCFQVFTLALLSHYCIDFISGERLKNPVLYVSL